MVTLSQCFSNFSCTYECPRDLVKNADPNVVVLEGTEILQFQQTPVRSFNHTFRSGKELKDMKQSDSCSYL